MRLSKKKEKEFAVKIRQIKELEQQKKQIEESINDIKDEIKAFMDKTRLPNWWLTCLQFTGRKPHRNDSTARNSKKTTRNFIPNISRKPLQRGFQ